MSATRKARLGAAIVAVAPAILLAGFVYHPYLSPPTDEAAIAAAVASDTMRWGLAQVAIGLGYALAVLAFIAVRSYFREVGEERWSVLALPPRRVATLRRCRRRSSRGSSRSCWQAR